MVLPDDAVHKAKMSLTEFEKKEKYPAIKHP